MSTPPAAHSARPARDRAWYAPLLLAVLSIPAAGIAGEHALPIDFDRDVRPILVARCFRCHGPAVAEAGLRLNDPACGLGVLESGHRAVVPGKPDESALIRRVSDTNGEQMPPDAPLSDDEIATLRAWVAQGADWPAHWAYRPLQAATPPPPSDRLAPWCRTSVDRFIAATLVESGLSPSPEADRRTLLRRVTLDLTGLPPMPEDSAAFLADQAPDAYEQLVERLLASPHYGERWARRWMDLVHYAESHGQDQDRPREHAWPYRDYLIRAFNEDMPYARFVSQQVAGDALFPEDPQAIVATGFLATGPWDESSLRDIREDSIDREIGRYLDRDDIVTTVMSTLASTSVHCARCHDHKFDPVSQADYYALQAVFAATDKANRPYDPDPEVARRRKNLLARRDRVTQWLADRDPRLLELLSETDRAAWEAEYARSSALWRIAFPVTARSGGGATLTAQDDGSIVSSGARPDKDVYTLELRPADARLTGLRVEVLTHDDLPHRGPGRQDNGNFHLSELRMQVIDPQRPGLLRELALQNPVADFEQEGWGIAAALDGNPNTAWGIHPAVGDDHVAVLELAAPLEIASGALLRVELQQLHGGGHLIGRLRVATTGEPAPFPQRVAAPPAAVRAALAVPPGERTLEQQLDVAGWCLQHLIAHGLNELPQPSLVYCGTSTFEPDGSFRPADTPREVYVLQRGQISAPGEPARPGTIGCLDGLPARFAFEDPQNEGARRAALARWLADERNVLVWRSIVNRAWQLRFGRGLVDTPSDFGQLGSAPSHPELLDWLAREFQRHGGSLKWLDRLLVTSAVYRQSSAHRDDMAAIDQANIRLWRMNSRRLDAEQIRDAMLAQAGRLDTQMEGPSVRQFIQTPGIHVTPNVDYFGFDVDAPANRRRSIYRFVFRTLPDPFMEAMDCPDASQLAPERNESVTALQALATLNDKLVARLSEHLAQRIEAAHAPRHEQVRALFAAVLAREPSADEQQAVADYVAQHGLANACRFLWNTNEFMFVD